MKIETVSLSVPDLKQIVVKCFLDNSDLLSCIFKLEVYGFIFLVVETCV